MRLGVESLRVFIVVVGMWLLLSVELFSLRSYSASLSLSALTCAGASVKTHGKFPELLECVLAFLILFEVNCFHILMEVKLSQRKSVAVREVVNVWVCVLQTMQHWNVYRKKLLLVPRDVREIGVCVWKVSTLELKVIWLSDLHKTRNIWIKSLTCICLLLWGFLGKA